MATDKQNAQETQKIFQSAVDICMNGKLDSLQALISKATSQLKDFIPQVIIGNVMNLNNLVGCILSTFDVLM